VEEWFYLLFPAGLWLALRLGRGAVDRAFLASAATFFLLAVVARTLGASHPGASWEGTQRCIVLYRFDALMMGVLAAWLSVRHPQAWLRHARRAAGLGIILFAACYATLWNFNPHGVAPAAETFFARTFRFDLLSLSFALLLPAASAWSPARETPLHIGVRKIALWSYALYLIHWPLFQIANSAPLQAWANTGGAATVLFLGKLAVAVGLSAAFYHFYEGPCTRLREKLPRLFGARPPVAPEA
jgi:peptidoglycan/LPS O-acetylase OafA/YrhL